MEASPWRKVADAGAPPEGQRLHFCLEGRYITLLRLEGRLSCIDSICFHAGGPLGIGDIEDVNGRACLVCPWHYYKIDLVSGEKYYQAVAFKDGKMVPGEWKSNGHRQRVHPVEEREDGIYTMLQATGDMASDEYACNDDCGSRVLSASRGRGGPPLGGDGVWKSPSGRLQQLLGGQRKQQR